MIDFVEASHIVAANITDGLTVEVDVAREALADDLIARAARIDEALEFVGVSRDRRAADDLLKRVEFREKFPDLEFALSQEYLALIYTISEGRGDEVNFNDFVAAEKRFRDELAIRVSRYQPELTSARLSRIPRRAAHIREMRTLGAVLKAYADCDDLVSLFERCARAAVEAFEAGVQLEIDRARGK